MFKKLKLYIVHFFYILGLLISFVISFLLFQNRKKKEKIESLRRKNLSLLHNKEIVKAEIRFERLQKERKREIERDERLVEEENLIRNMKFKNRKNKKSRNGAISQIDLAKNKNLKLNKDKDFVSVYK